MASPSVLGVTNGKACSACTLAQGHAVQPTRRPCTAPMPAGRQPSARRRPPCQRHTACIITCFLERMFRVPKKIRLNVTTCIQPCALRTRSDRHTPPDALNPVSTSRIRSVHSRCMPFRIWTATASTVYNPPNLSGGPCLAQRDQLFRTAFRGVFTRDFPAQLPAIVPIGGSNACRF